MKAWLVVFAVACALALTACIPILAQETIVQPQPPPQCGDCGRPYSPPPPGPLLAPRPGEPGVQPAAPTTQVAQ